MLRLQIIVVSTRPGRIGPFVANWFFERVREHAKFELELVSLSDANLPLLDEPRHPSLGQYEHAHTKAWSTTISRGDAYVFVTPEYDYSTPASFMNALQCLSKEWAYKAAGFVSYGGVSAGLRSVQMAKQLVTSLRMMPIAEGVAIPFVGQYLNRETGQFTPAELQHKAATVMLDELLKWSAALRPLRPA